MISSNKYMYTCMYVSIHIVYGSHFAMTQHERLHFHEYSFSTQFTVAFYKQAFTLAVSYICVEQTFDDKHHLH